MLPSASGLESLHFSYQSALDTLNEDESDFCTLWAVHRLRMKPKFREGRLVSVLRPSTSEILVTDEPPSISIQEEVRNITSDRNRGRHEGEAGPHEAHFTRVERIPRCGAGRLEI